MRPLWYEFPNDVSESIYTETQYLLGPSIMLAPKLSLPSNSYKNPHFLKNQN